MTTDDAPPPRRRPVTLGAFMEQAGDSWADAQPEPAPAVPPAILPALRLVKPGVEACPDCGLPRRIAGTEQFAFCDWDFEHPACPTCTRPITGCNGRCLNCPAPEPAPAAPAPTIDPEQAPDQAPPDDESVEAASTTAQEPAPLGPFRPAGQGDLAPIGAKAKAKANLVALHALAALRAEDRLTRATPAEQALLARYSGWGALPDIFGENKDGWVAEHDELLALLQYSPDAYAKARATTLNAHYTPAFVIEAVWAAARALGFDGGRVLEPGCGSGNFIGFAPGDLPIEMVGVELDPTTAAVAQALYPHAQIRAEGFEATRYPDGHFDLVVGNVPFAKHVVHDPRYNARRLTIHNYCIYKGLRFLRPGAYALVVTSRYTLDSTNNAARTAIAELADLVGAVRLPNGAMRASAGTDVIVDVLVLRRKIDGATPIVTDAWAELAEMQTATGPVFLNEYFVDHPDHVLGTIESGRGIYANFELMVRHRTTIGPEVLAATLKRIALRAAHMGHGHLPRPAEAVAAPAAPAPAYQGRFPSRTCSECGRVFNLLDENDADEFYNGHDCEEPPGPAAAAAPRPPRQPRPPAPVSPPGPSPLDPMPIDSYPEGSIVRAGNGFVKVTDGIAVPFEPSPRCDAAEVGELCDLRDTLARLLAAQAADDDDAAFAELQRTLNERYDVYEARHGPLGRFKLARTGHVDDEGNERLRRNYPRMGGFREDPGYYTVLSLEDFDPEEQTATKAAIFSARVVGPRSARSTADSPHDALAICLDQLGRVDLRMVAKLLSVDEDRARAALVDLVWEEPITGDLVPAYAYLSGNVREKRALAVRAAAGDPAFQRHVDALEAVMPKDLGPKEIRVRLGVPWVPASDVHDFLQDTLVDRRTRPYDHIDVEYAKPTATWEVRAANHVKNTVLMTSTWGTAQANALELVHSSLNQVPHKVYDTVDDGYGGTKQVLNVDATYAARDKQDALAKRWGEWLWEDPARSRRICATYNELFNSHVVPVFDGSHMTCPGLSLDFRKKVHPHQLDVAFRILQSDTTGVFHAVGAGKTAALTIALLESRRLGLVNKPAVIAPNHMLVQWATDVLQLYPTAKILVPTPRERTRAGRKAFVARCALGDWDLVVLTHSMFERIPVSAELHASYIARKIEAIDDAKGGARITVKRMELAKKRMEEKQKKLLAAEAKDDGVQFELTGIDYIAVDESQAHKNLNFPSHIQEAGGQGSNRAADLEIKLEYLRSKYGKRVVSFATATPIANTIAEMFVVQRYLQPDLLRKLGIFEFDAWAATFASTVSVLELSPDGKSYRIHTRFAKFHNVPELLRLFHLFADVRTPDQLNLPVPHVIGDKAETLVVPASAELKELIEDLVRRADRIRKGEVKPDEDNMLKVCTDGRKAGTDLRLLGLPPDPDGGKIAAAAERIAAIHDDTRDLEYLDAGMPSARPGGLQVVFCDLGTPRRSWNVYDQLRDELIERGLPAERVRFVHEAASARQKEDLFADARAGRISVLVGSTDKMGIGTNVQNRLVALHHLDCPWRPDQLEQRDGRGLRQGNQNMARGVNVCRYVTQGSFDVYMWQTVERKAGFIHQVIKGDVTEREIDDVGDAALSYAEIKALATGNPLILRKAGLELDVARLRRLRYAHEDDQADLAWFIQKATDQVPGLAAGAERCEAAIAQRAPGYADAVFHIGDTTFEDNADAGEALVAAAFEVMKRGATGARHWVGHFAGFDIVGKYERTPYGYDPACDLYLDGADVHMAGDRDAWKATVPWRLAKAAVKGLGELEAKAADRRRKIAHLEAEAARATERYGLPFDQELTLAGAERDLAAVNTQLEEQLKEKDDNKEESA